ncbi:hypothetical protein SFR_3327 [Streptomyces sp. FR-008]|nr:hypothetical protein SFR_3327 [Streptomyces sp. FR-008]
MPGEPQRQRCVLLDGQLGQQLAVLKHVPEPLSPQRRQLLVPERSVLPAFEAHRTGGRRQHSGQAVQQRTLAGPAAAGDRHDLTGHECEIGTLHGELRAVPDIDAPRAEYGGRIRGHRGGSSFSPGDGRTQRL